jgi:hypothetical protein
MCRFTLQWIFIKYRFSLQMALPLCVLCLSFRGLFICFKVPGLETTQMYLGSPCESQSQKEMVFVFCATTEHTRNLCNWWCCLLVPGIRKIIQSDKWIKLRMEERQALVLQYKPYQSGSSASSTLGVGGLLAYIPGLSSPRLYGKHRPANSDFINKTDFLYCVAQIKYKVIAWFTFKSNKPTLWNAKNQ